MTMQTTRRDALIGLGAGAAGALLAACSGAARSTSAQVSDDDAEIARLLAMPDPHVPRRPTPYRLTRPVRLPAGRVVRVDPETRFAWAGPTGAGDALVGVFQAEGANSGLTVAGGIAHVACETPSPHVYAVMMAGQDGLEVTGVQAHNCQHVRVHNARTYAGVETDGPGINVARRVRVRGGGARFDVAQTVGHGSCLFEYAVDARLADAVYENVANGVQWWGGNAHHNAALGGNGAPGNARKCRDVVVERVTVRRCTAGIWGAMGQNVTVRDCRVDTALDVGFDAEGSIAVAFERCSMRNGHNGCFSTFFLCDGVRFVDCTATVDSKAFPLFRVYNETQSSEYNKGVEIVGGRFECRDPSGAGVLDTAAGPVQSIAVTGATLVNARIDFAFSNMHSVRIANNVLTFPHALGPVAAIRAGHAKALRSVPGSVAVMDNRISMAAGVQGGGSVAIELREDDFNASATDQVSGNTVSGPFAAGLSLINASGNVGIRPRFAVRDNRFTGLPRNAPLLRVKQEGVAVAPDVSWSRQSRDGAPVALSEARR